MVAWRIPERRLVEGQELGEASHWRQVQVPDGRIRGTGFIVQFTSAPATPFDSTQTSHLRFTPRSPYIAIYSIYYLCNTVFHFPRNARHLARPVPSLRPLKGGQYGRG